MVRTFVLPCFVLFLMLYGPGYLSLRTARFPYIWALCLAPVVSYGLIGLLGEAYMLAGVPATPLTVFAPLVVLPLAALLVRRVRAKQAGKSADAGELDFPELQPWAPCMFALVGLVVFNYLVLSRLEGPNDVNQSYDVVNHLSVTQAFIDSKTISSLRIWRYLSAEDKAIAPYGSPGLYPAGWHALCALLAEALGMRVPMAVNTSLIVTLGVVWPLSLCAFMAFAFEGDRRTLLFGALTSIAFVAFPWILLLFGPLYPNLAGFTLTPATGVIIMIMVRQGLTLRQRLAVAVAFVAAGAGQTFLHPNTVFTVVVMMTPYCAYRCFTWAHNEKGYGVLKALGLAGAFLAAVAAAWMVCYYSPLFRSSTSELWPGFAYPWQEIINILTQTYTLFFNGEYAAQAALGVLVVIGCVRAAYDPDRRWLLVSYLLFCYIAYVGATHYNDFLKHVLGGFWYTDASRLASMCCITAAPLAAYGLSWVSEQALVLVRRYNDANHHASHPRLTIAVVGCIFITLNFMPGFNWPGKHSKLSDRISEYRSLGREYVTYTVRTTFGDYRYGLSQVYLQHRPVDVQELEFLEDITPVVGDDLVINNPMDGSVLAYGMNGIRTYYRNFRGYGGTKETDASEVIRLHLSEYATNAEVAAAVEEIDARWVIVMNTLNSRASFINLRRDFSNKDFAGILSLSPDSEGFELVTQNGACALYRIVR